MKKLIGLIVCCSMAASGMAQPNPSSGRLKITIENITCINKSWDGLVEFDGHGNEVSVNFSYRIYSPSNPGAARRGIGGTPIFGSNVNGMTRAGTQTPDLGGINNGDVVPLFRPVIDEHISADEYIIFAPTVWEWDGQGNNTFSSFNDQLDSDLNWVITQSFPFANTPVSYREPFHGRVIKIFDKYPYGQAIKYHNIFANFLCPLLGQGSRPVNILAGTFNNQCMVVYPPTLLVLDTRVLSALATNNYSASQTSAGRRDKPSLITGIHIPFIEESYAIQTSNGSYSMFLKIEFIPDPTPATTLNEPAAPPIKLFNTIKTLPRKTITNSIPASITGTWAGPITSEDLLSSGQIDFELTGNGEYLIKDINGLVAQGTYTFSNNIINGTYKLVSNGETFSFAGTLDPVTQKLSCTMGTSPSTTGQGMWVVTKK